MSELLESGVKEACFSDGNRRVVTISLLGVQAVLLEKISLYNIVYPKEARSVAV